ncbi:MAG: ABC transporter permease, partial [Smithella sp.]
MAVPFSYSFRNLWKRRLTTILTVTGMALVVFVFAAVLMMAAGLQKTLVETGSPENVVVVRKASTSEVMSSVERKSAAIVEMLPQVAAGSRGQPMIAKESVVLIALKKKGEEQSSSHSNVVVRGIGAESLPL